MVVAIPSGNRSREHVGGDENSHPSSDRAWVGQADGGGWLAIASWTQVWQVLIIADLESPAAPYVY